MSDTELYYHRRILWHNVVLRFTVLMVPLILGRTLELIANNLNDLSEFLSDKLPNPDVLEKVPYDKLSKEEKLKPYKVADPR